MKAFSILIVSAILNMAMINALSNFDPEFVNNRTQYAFHFLGINGTAESNTVGYVQTYDGVKYYAYNGNSLCVLTATNTSGSVSKFTVSDDFGKCPGVGAGTLTELQSHANGYYSNANNRD